MNSRPLDSNYVVRDFKSHGMRALAQNVQRTRNKERQERPFLEGVDHPMSEMKIWRRGEAEVFGRGETIFTEGTFVTWDIDAPPIEKLRIEDYLGEHEDIIKHHISRESNGLFRFFSFKEEEELRYF